MPTESKKLQTILKDGGLFYPLAGRERSTYDIESVRAFRHDARIAHQQREVIRQLYAALKEAFPCIQVDGDLLEESRLEFNAEQAIAVAAPFLED